MFMRSVMFTVVFAIIGCVSCVAKEKRAKAHVNKARALAIVEQYLFENEPDPEYQVVRSWNPVSLKGAHEWHSELRGKGRVSGDSGYLWNEITTKGSAIRLKYRAKNSLGGWTIVDGIYLIDLDDEIFNVLPVSDFLEPGKPTQVEGLPDDADILGIFGGDADVQAIESIGSGGKP